VGGWNDVVFESVESESGGTAEGCTAAGSSQAV